MVSSRLSRLRVLGFAAAMAAAGAGGARADMLAPAECQKLDTERRALMVLGVDKYVEKGADWAKANLTVADLDLVKRYFDVFEQLKFRCEEDIGVVEVDEPDTVDDDNGAGQQTAAPGSAAPAAASPAPAEAGAAPPVPPKRAKPLSHSSAIAAPAFTGSTAPAPTGWEANTTSIAKRPRQPVQ